MKHSVAATRPPGSDTGPQSAPAVRLREIRKSFTRRDGTHVPAVDGISLDVAQGEFVVLLGPSGCGKTTLLRCIAGLEQPDEGVIEIHGKEHFSSLSGRNTSPDRRNLGMIFQSYALWPHMNVYDNVAYSLKTKKIERELIRERVDRVLRMVGVWDVAGQYPGQLSGGQQQRVALARALVSNTGLVLFDEPLSNVDAKVREQLRFEILRMQEEIGFAAVYVTHDQAEAMELADRIAVLNTGRIAQLSPPQEVYDQPADRYVARFIGATNEWKGVITHTAPDGYVVVKTSAGQVQGVAGQPGLVEGDHVSVIVRPERCSLTSHRPSEEAPSNVWSVELVTSMFLGSHREFVVTAAGLGDFRVHVPADQDIDAGGVAPLYLTVPRAYSRVLRPEPRRSE